MNYRSSFAIAVVLSAGFGTAYSQTTRIRNARPASTPAASPAAKADDGDWAGYNRTLTSDRYSPLAQVTTVNVGGLKQVCTFDVGEGGNFQSGIIVIDGTLYVTTDTNTEAIDAATCRQRWKHHYNNPTPEGLRVNRGAAYADGKLFRGINAGYLMALDANTGKFLWEKKMADPVKGESVPAAPIAWNGMIFSTCSRSRKRDRLPQRLRQSG